jgi:hypothetical protein
MCKEEGSKGYEMDLFVMRCSLGIAFPFCGATTDAARIEPHSRGSKPLSLLFHIKIYIDRVVID